MTDRQSLQGYLSDEGVYPSNFHREFTPPWIDAMLRHRGFMPPRGPRAPFRLLDLGTGDGFGLIMQAAAHPEGEFTGVDAHPPHVAMANALAEAIGLPNIRFRCAYFSDLEALAAPDHDYVTAQGVMSWISTENQDHVRRIARRWLRPGGVACLGYNTLPGWKDGQAFQRMVRLFAEAEQGESVARFDAALTRVRAMGEAGAASFVPALMTWIDGLRATLPPSYFPHEYLNRYWMPHWAGDMIEAMAAEGFAFAGSARPERLRPDFAFRKAQRAELARIASPSAREIAEDIFLHCSFRTELYAYGVAAPSDPMAARLQGWWASLVAPDKAAYSCRTTAGTLDFANDAARAILAGLAAGPASLASIHASGGAGTHADILNAADALFISGQILPCDPPAMLSHGDALNAEIARRAARGDGINALATPHGALPVQMPVIALAWGGQTSDEANAARALLARLATPPMPAAPDATMD